MKVNDVLRAEIYALRYVIKESNWGLQREYELRDKRE